MKQPNDAGGPYSEEGRAQRLSSEFICSGCGGPLDVVPTSDVCLMEAWRLCPECERAAELRRKEPPPPAPGTGAKV